MRTKVIHALATHPDHLRRLHVCYLERGWSAVFWHVDGIDVWIVLRK